MLRRESSVGIAAVAWEKVGGGGDNRKTHEGGGRWAGRRRGGLLEPAREAELQLVLLAVFALGSSAWTGSTGEGGRDRRTGGRSRGQDRGRSARWRRRWGRVTGRDAVAGEGGGSDGGVPNRGVLERTLAVASHIGGGSADAVTRVNRGQGGATPVLPGEALCFVVGDRFVPHAEGFEAALALDFAVGDLDRSGRLGRFRSVA